MAEGIEEERSIGGVAGVADADDVRAQLRRRWELASVLNFLRVFRPVIGEKLELTGEEVEEGLMRPDDVLARIHVALLKGIPPVGKNVEARDMWVTLVCKQMDMWWSWVADGEAPIKSNRGGEIPLYKSLDPLSRLVILKALCEIRAVQDDVIAYIDEMLKNGSPLSTFRKDKIGTDSDGNDYWWDGDTVMGYRLYRERIPFGGKQKLGGKDPTQLVTSSQWETLACDLDQFQDISVRLSESKASEDVAVAEILKTELLPLVEKMQKKKERALKRQQREVLHLTGCLGVSAGSRRSCRDRKPAKYTFDDYDQIIDNALQTQRKRKVSDVHTEEQDKLQKVDENGKSMASGSEDEDYHDENDNADISSDDNSETEQDELDDPASKQKRSIKMIGTAGLRRSMRNIPFSNETSCAVSNGHAEMKRRLRQRLAGNTDYSIDVPDSDEENSGDDLLVKGDKVDPLLHSVSTPATTAVR